MMTDATINVPSLMPISAEPADQHSIQHGSAATMLPAVVRAFNFPKPKRRKMVVSKFLAAMNVGKGVRPSSGSAEDLKKGLAALEAKLNGQADRLAQVEGHGKVVTATVDLLAASVDSRFAVLAAELNQYAVQVEQGKAAVEASLQAHLARIDGTFQQCDAILGTMHGLLTTAPAVAPPTTAAPQFFTQDLLNIRRSIDDGLAKTMEVKNNLEKLEDRYIHESIAATAEQAWSREQINTFWVSLTKVDQTLRADLEVEFSTVRAELQAATATRSQQTAAGASGQKPAQSFLDERGLFRDRQAPGESKSEPTPSGWQDHGNRPGRDSQDEEDDEGSQHTGQPRHSPPQRFDIHSDRGATAGEYYRLLQRESRSPFETKDRGDLPKFNGQDKGDLWRKKTTYFLTNKCPDVKPFLKWAEQQREVITPDSMRRAWYSEELKNVRNDPRVLAFHLFGFLNTNLVGEAWDVYDSVGDDNGFEVWRLINLDVTQKTQAEVLALEHAVLNPKKLIKLRDIPTGLVNWDNSYRAYVEAGGRALDDDRKIGALMRLFPDAVCEKVLWEMEKFEGKPLVLRRWVKEHTKLLVNWDSPDSGRPRAANLLDAEENAQSEDEGDLENKSREELCALVRRGAGGRFGAARQATPKKKAGREPPARDARDVRCGNCAAKGHTSQNCPEERRGPLSRTCFHCGETGHLAAKCPKAPAAGLKTRPVRSLDEVDGVPKILDCRLLANDGYTPIHRLRRRGAERLRRQPGLEECNINRFSALEAETTEANTDKNGPSPKLCQSYNAKTCEDNNCTMTLSRVDTARSGARLCVPTEEAAVPKPQPLPEWGANVVSNIYPGMNILFPVENLHALPEFEEPEWLEVECCLDTGSSIHAADRIDFPGFDVTESDGSRAGQKFQAAGGSLIDNEGQVNALMTAPGSPAGTELQFCFQIAKVTRPLISVTKMTEKGELQILCRKDEALVLDGENKTVAKFARKGGLYVAVMKVRNPRFAPFHRPATR